MAVIGIDFDGTMVDADYNALPGLKDAINQLREQNHKIVIHSANNKSWIERTLNNLDIRYDYIWDGKGKPNCDIFLDDKGYHFPYNGSWTDELPKIIDRLKGLDNRKWKLPSSSSMSS